MSPTRTSPLVSLPELITPVSALSYGGYETLSRHTGPHPIQFVKDHLPTHHQNHEPKSDPVPQSLKLLLHPSAKTRHPLGLSA